MTTAPAANAPSPIRPDVEPLVERLRARVEGEVSSSNLRRAEYSTDASNYRVVPEVVVIPASIDDVIATLELCREAGIPITTRGGGTSIAGNSIGPGVVIDFSRHLNKIISIDPVAQTAVIEPGVIMSDLQKAAAPYGLRFGPDPSTQNRATLGGMIGNNACGPHAVAYGRTSDNIIELDVIDGTGRRFTVGPDGQGMDAVAGLAELVQENLALIRTELGRFGRQVSGYSLEHLLPENGSNLAKALAGTEGSVVTMLRATVRLVPVPSAPTLVVLGYESMPLAADDVPLLLACKPLAIEGMDARLIDIIKRAKGRDAVPTLPAGSGWLMVEVGGETAEDAMENARNLVRVARTEEAMIFPAGPEATRMWRIRADGAGLAGRTPSGDQGWPGWEDAAVLPENLGAYLRDFDRLLEEYGLDGVPYGHFGDGCIHVRINLPLEDNAAVFRRFLEDAAALVARHGGSLSGEHGDGRARSELLPAMYSQQAIDLFAQFKGLFDPNDLLNPGVVVRPDPLDANLRRPNAKPVNPTTGFAFKHDGGDFTKAVHRCTGVGKCRADNFSAGGFMCPSYQATRDEKDVTRGRARVLQELVNGSLITGSWSAPEVADALDLCLSCKACSSDCPAGVDMAAYKAEVLHRKYERKVRPVNHYVLGWLPRWARLVSGFAPLAAIANWFLSFRPFARLVLRVGGMDPRRAMATFATEPFRKWVRKQDEVRLSAATPSSANGAAAARPRVVLWADSFSDSMTPDTAKAALRVLDAAGYDVIVPGGEACCGLTWISTGQLSGARKKQEQLLKVLGPFAVAGIPIIGVEPSCTGVLRSDLLELHPDDPRAVAVANKTMTLAELLTAPAPVGPEGRWTMPDLSDVTAIVQPHCHHHSVMGFGPDEKLLKDAGAQLTTLSGCCGLAGNFGMENGHYEVSVQVAENELLPALRAAGEGDIFMADGFSCRTQAADLAGVQGKTLAQVIADRL
ncbi:FAD-binding and (Fe-S)-binding domain-containing protein [Rarobacter incanus]|uniref:FAD/FMN-containing dehydrogenase n=1 Tax=Rarobacter incanus TaxID=153494 RepID=A0A542SP89_9MICO|nr:FAD-binding and (Fe-S)-binding domain-containing protein [Rarobacter incanus]TQK76378.1 FAD/FMN-containing dehydrogenase [Rarobacter incanus]